MQLLDNMNFLGGATSLDSFLKAFKTEETKGFFPYEWFDSPEILNNKELPPHDSFFSKLRNIIPLETDYNDFGNLTTSGLSTKQAVCKVRLRKISPTGDENYSYFRSIWLSDGMKSFKDFLMWYSNKDVVPTLEAMQKMIEFYHQKEIVMLKLGCTLTNFANICLHKSPDSKFYLFTENDKDLLEKIRDDMVGGPSIVFTRKAVVEEFFYLQINEFVQVNFRHRHKPTLSLFDVQPMPTGLYTRWIYDTESQKFKPRQNKTGSFENMVFSCFQQTRPQCKIESKVTTGSKRRLIALVLMEFVTIVTLCSKQWVVFSTTVHAKKLARH